MATAKKSFNPRAREGRDTPISSQITGADVSIHAPARGATFHDGVLYDSISVSIHAPARGATCGGRLFWSGCAVSIHAPARGATSSMPPTSTPSTVFQSTRPRGARRANSTDR